MRTHSLDFALLVTLLVAISVPRVLALDRIVTPDEPLWLARAANFYEGLARGDLDATYQFVHPGVTVMWAGALGFVWQYRDYPDDAGGQIEWRGDDLVEILGAHGRSVLDMLVSLRLVLTLFSALVLATAFLSATRLLGRWIAFAGFLLIALDPFHIALSRLLHLDGLSTNLLLLSVLSFLSHVSRRRKSDLIISAVAAGFAWLTRSANFVLGPFLLIVVLLELAPVWRHHRSQLHSLVRTWWWTMVAWTGIGLTVFVAFWPAMWVSPIRTLSLMISGTFDLASEAHERQVFFAGEVMTSDPGWHFYPVVFFWRSNPVVLFGLLLAMLAAFLPKSLGQKFPRRSLFQIVIFAATYALILSAGEKKLDRYLLPSYSALVIVAGAGWVAGTYWLVRFMGPRLAMIWQRQLASAAFLTIVAMGSVATVASAYPYYIDYYNPLLGGSTGAREAMMVGWGEGMDLVADQLLEIPNIEESHVTAGPWPNSLAYYLPIPVQKPEYDLDDRAIRQWAWTDYRVVTYPEVQRQLIHPTLLAFFRTLKPVTTIELNGREYAWVYDLRTTPLPDYFLQSDLPIVDWENDLRYVGTRVPTKIFLPGDRVHVTLYFQSLDSTDRRLRAEVRLLAPDGRTLDVDDDTADRPELPRTLWPEVQSLIVPSDAKPGTYQVVLVVKDFATGRPLLASRASSGARQASELVIQSIEVGSED